MLEWLIVGGGVHGTHLSHVLTAEAGVPRELVRVLDPHPEPLARWTECTENAGMRLLRSPYVHHLDTAPFSLRQFSRTTAARGLGGLVGFYRRPTLALFRAHTERVVAGHGLAELRVQGRATGIRRCRGGFRVHSDRGSLHARRVLLAISASEQPHWPEWARDLRAAGAAVDHLFEPGFRRDDLPDWSRLVVVGGGISAAQAALALARRLPGTVTLLMRHPMRIHQFDSDPGWIGPRFQASLRRERDPARRRAIVDAARHRGSFPPEVAAELRRALLAGLLRLRQEAVEGAELRADAVVLRTSRGEPLEADRVVLATGFEAARPGGDWLDRAVRELDLRCAPCGYPLVDERLCWTPGLFVTGALAELELGPVARNIVGARNAADRLRAA
jgi:cation diffusion facilitator CzcD-associated flavoprotein CzcO